MTCRWASRSAASHFPATENKHYISRVIFKGDTSHGEKLCTLLLRIQKIKTNWQQALPFSTQLTLVYSLGSIQGSPALIAPTGITTNLVIITKTPFSILNQITILFYVLDVICLPTLGMYLYYPTQCDEIQLEPKSINHIFNNNHDLQHYSTILRVLTDLLAVCERLNWDNFQTPAYSANLLRPFNPTDPEPDMSPLIIYPVAIQPRFRF